MSRYHSNRGSMTPEKLKSQYDDDMQEIDALMMNLFDAFDYYVRVTGDGKWVRDHYDNYCKIRAHHKPLKRLLVKHDLYRGAPGVRDIP